jgi:NAD(P)-dependent dehydrogenase (short-subunit alcohol dehydrogenase family)
MSVETILITGASRGLGAALAQHQLSLGARVIAFSRSLPAWAGDLPPEQSERTFFFELDLSEPDPALRTWKAVLGDLAIPEGRLTLIHNAGEVRPIGAVGSGLEGMAQAIAVNYTSPVLLTDAFVQWAETGGFNVRVLFISTGAARRPMPYWAAYASAKAGIDQYAQCMAAEQAGKAHPLQVVSLAPGVIDTEMQAVIREHPQSQFPGVNRFLELKSEGKLWSAAYAAGRISALLASPGFGSETLMDLRTFAG